MPLPRGRRNAYNPISSTESNEEDDNDPQQQQQHQQEGTSSNSTFVSTGDVGRRASTTTTTSTSNNRRNRRGNYNRIATTDNTAVNNNNTVSMQPVSKEDTPLNTTKALFSEEDEDVDDVDDDTTATNMTVIILDSAQKKFPIQCHTQWTIGKLKKKSYKIHKVPPSQQRLIFRGKMLNNDTQTLQEVKIDTDNVIIHLFPKPRVVVTNAGSSVSVSDGTASNNMSGNGSGGSSSDNADGAHIPSIVIDQEEQERRGQILVLGSVEIAESQNNIKMLSLLLLVISSMRLLALFSIAMGVAEEPAYDTSGDDTVPPSDRHNTTHNHSHHHSGTDSNNPYNDPSDMEMRAWRTSDYFDLVVSAIGFYVATLGMKATQENTLRLANAYMIGTIIAGIGWNAWNVFMYIMFVDDETAPTEDDEIPPLSRDDFITVAFFTVAMPLFVWGLCCARAYEFRRLISEAEEEAAERIRSQITTVMGGSGSENAERELMDLSATRTEIV